MQEIVEMKGLDFDKARERLKEIIHDIRQRGSEAAKLLSQMSSPQLKIIKQDFKGIWSADQIERLAMLGRGEIAEWLALRPKSIPASVLRRLPEQAISVLSDPESEVEVLTSRGVQIRQVQKLSSVEMSQIVDPTKGILKAEDQVKRMIIPPKDLPSSDIEDTQSVKLSDDRKHLLVKTKLVTVRIQMKMLRKFIA